MKKKLAVLAPFAKPKPWRRRRARPVHAEVAICDRPPLAQIDIYAETVILTRRRPDGTWSSYPVAPDALTQILGRLPASSGLLPVGILATGQYQGHAFFVQYIRPRLTTLQVEEGSTVRLIKLTTPPLIWAGWERTYKIWAVRVEPGQSIDRRTRLCVAPFPNTYASGGICWGSAGRPKPASATEMGPALKFFLEESVFNTHVADGKSKAFPASVLRRYDALAPDAAYPLDDLEDAPATLGQVIDGSAWRSTL